MESENREASFKSPLFEKLDWILAGALTLLAASVFCLGLADYAYPGESARLMSLWRGLDVTTEVSRPLSGWLSRLCGGGNAIAPLAGSLAVGLVYLLTAFFFHERVQEEAARPRARTASRLAAGITAVVFLFLPVTLSAATHLEVRMLAFTWALLALVPLVVWTRFEHWAADLVCPLMAGAMWGLGIADSSVFVATLPLAGWAAVAGPIKRERSVWPALVLFLGAAFVGFTLLVCLGGNGFVADVRGVFSSLKAGITATGFVGAEVFSTVPFLVALVGSRKALNRPSAFVQWTANLALGFFAVLALATPFSAGSMMAERGILPVVETFFAASLTGYLAAFMYLAATVNWETNESLAEDVVFNPARSRTLAGVAGGILGFVFVFNAIFSLAAFDSREGEFADRVAAKALDELGARQWIVTDGFIDDHLLNVAADRGQAVTLLPLVRDEDEVFLEQLKERIRAAPPIDDIEVLLSLDLGVRAFVQDWFAADERVGEKAAVLGSSEMWLAAGREPVPGFVLMGAAPAQPGDWTAWEDFAGYLKADDGWGSYRVGEQPLSPAGWLRMELRRHLGLMSVEHGFYLHGQGKEEEAYANYLRAYEEIDRDNVSALFNLFGLALEGRVKAAKLKQVAYRNRLEEIVKDKSRRYMMLGMARYYGPIHNRELLVKLGEFWQERGRSGEALGYLRRAQRIHGVKGAEEDSDQMLKLIASAYSLDEGDKSREVYERLLARNPDDHGALLGMMRLALNKGDMESARGYLERAVAVAGDDPRVRVEKAMLALMNDCPGEARKLLLAVTDDEPENLAVWGLLATATMQLCDLTTDPDERRKLEDELVGSIVPTMEKLSDSSLDFHLQTIRAFLALRSGVDEEARRHARDSLVIALKMRPGVDTTRNMVLGLDISLDDRENAALHAREVLRTDRQSPLANYVLGSLAMTDGDEAKAELYLKRAVQGEQPVAMALNDLAELSRRRRDFDTAERYARRAVEVAPGMYVAWETLGSVLMDAGRDSDEAAACVEKACELSKDATGRETDIRMVMALARVRLKRGEKRLARQALERVEARKDELSEFELGEYEALKAKLP